ncbi:MAG TPA: hypothetical protein VM103_02205 [Candidatus Paceibacterota bacterium]|nr:hypothetical protein [Candidatus Paceibacterota bacterium]
MKNKMYTAADHRGVVLLVTLVFFAVFFTVAAAFISYVTSYAKSERHAVGAAQALALAEAGIDKAVYELNQNSSYAGETDTVLGSGTVTIAVTNVDSTTKRIAATGYIPNRTNPVATRTVKVTAGINSSTVSFHYGVQAGTGGFELFNSSKITGNVFASGPVIGHSSNLIYGDVISSGAGGLVYGVHATSSIYAHTIGNASGATIADRDAYYYGASTVNTTVSGTRHPGSADQSPADLPISDAQISEWESDAAAGGTISSCDASGNYTITSSMSLGPKKIACNLVIKSSSSILTITGPLWVTGNVTTQTGPTIKMDASLGSQNVAIIADNPSNPTGSGIITVGQSTIFQGSGSPGSFVFLISQNTSAENGGSTVAVNMSQGASALVAYAAHGLVSLSQSVSVKEVTGYKISLTQSANVVYDTGLPSTVFESGPGASWTFTPGTYSIVQ